MHASFQDLLTLFCVFARIGGLTFGGGLTMLPMLQYELVQKKQWITEEELMDCYAIGQCTPGIIAVNTATFVGYKRGGVRGGIAATLGMVAPSLCIITIIAMFLKSYMDHPILQHAIMGIRGIVCALMLNTVMSLKKKSLTDQKSWAVAGLIFALAFFTKIPTLVLVIIGGVLGALFFGKKKEGEA